MTRTSWQGDGASTFTVGLWRGVWRVTCDDVFYGDFPVRQSAMDAAQTAARLPATRAEPAEILLCNHDI